MNKPATKLSVYDYSRPELWACLPSAPSLACDTIFFYPTFYSPRSLQAAAVCEPTEPLVRRYVPDYLKTIAPIFTASTNFYAPYYCQCDVRRFATRPDSRLLSAYPDQAKQSVYQALDYYFAHYNEGRPFILAGHSQGSTVLCLVLAEYLRWQPELMRRLVCAYVIGYGVTRDFLQANPHLRFANGSSDVGVIVSYNTEGPGNGTANNFVVPAGSLAINPINWCRQGTPAGSEQNLGSYFPSSSQAGSTWERERLAAYFFREGLNAAAYVDSERGVLICPNARPEVCSCSPVSIFGRQSYHCYDYYFYYKNLQANVAERLAQLLRAEK